MTLRLAVGVLALALMVSCGVALTLTGYEMLDRVNEKLAQDDQIDPVGWYSAKRLHLQREYRRLNPEGHLIRRSRVLLMMGCLFLTGVFT
jgi:hypothetical protein